MISRSLMWSGKSFLPLFLLAVFLNGLTWAFLVPVWHTPDEAAHFANVQNMAEVGQMHPSGGKDHSEELLLSERLLGTERGSRGTNKFTFHPEYRIPYSDNTIGPVEEEIKNFPQSSRTNFIKSESTNYPPLYYLAGSWFYRAFYNFDIFTRVLAVRLLSVLFLVGLAFFAFQSGLLLFKNKFYALVLASMVAFQPMIVFTSAGVTSDSLANLLFCIFLYLILKIINSGLTGKNIIFFGLTLGLGSLTKPQFLLTMPFVGLVFLYDFFKFRKSLSFYFSKIILFFSVFIISGGYIHIAEAISRYKDAQSPLPYIEDGNQTALVTNISFFNFLVWTFRHTIAEVLPWYWGVFNWLGVVLPKIVNQIINRILLFAAFGLVIKSILIIKKRHLGTFEMMISFLIFFAIFYFFVITWWDWGHFKSVGFSIGIQGRYFLPAVLPHMVIIFIGVLTFIPSVAKKYIASLLAVGMIVLNLIALYIVAQAYYDTSSLYNFLIQSSQYKSTVIKYPVNAILLSVYAVSLIGLFYILTIPITNNRHTNGYKVN